MSQKMLLQDKEKTYLLDCWTRLGVKVIIPIMLCIIPQTGIFRLVACGKIHLVMNFFIVEVVTFI